MSGHNNNKGDLQEFLALIAAAPAVIEGVNEILKSAEYTVESKEER